MADNQERLEKLLALIQADPEGGAKLVNSIMGKMLIPHSDGQKDVLLSEARYMVLCAGRRWGKSQVGAARALKAAREPGTIIWWAAPTYKNVKHGYRACTKQCPDGLLAKPAPPETAFDAGRAVALEFKNGSRIQFFSADRPEGMLGGSCDFLILDEAATMPEVVWTQYLRATLADRQGRALFISTPRGKNWFYKLWTRGQSKAVEDKDFQSWRFPSFTNPTIPASEWEDARRDLPLAVYEQEVLAEFISNAASVFRFPPALDQFGKRLDDVPSPAVQASLEVPTSHVVLGVDLAKHNDFTVLLGINTHNRRVCYHDRFNQVSWPEQRKLIHEAVEDIMETASGITVMLDSTGVGDVIYDDLSEEGLDAVPIKFTPQWKQAAVQLLSADIERGQAYVYDEALAEFESYSYQITEAGRWKYEAATGHDDEVSAALLAHWGIVHSGVPNVQTLTVESTADVVDEWNWESEGQMVDTGVPQRESSGLTPSMNELLHNPNVWN